MTVKIDFIYYPTKQKFFDFLTTKIDGLFGKNYDALIDALTFYKTPITFILLHISFFEDKENLLEIIKIIHKENTLITFKLRA